MRTFIIIIFFSLCSVNIGKGNNIYKDTAYYSLAEVEKMFLENNLLVLASRFNIDAAQAQVMQSRLWENPTVYLEQNVYNQYTRKAFDITNTGQNIVQIQQLFLLAGKRNKSINLSQINSQIAEYQFYDLLRSLRYELRSVFFTTHYLLQTKEMYEEEITSLTKTLDIFDVLLKKSAISLKEVIRIKALLFNLESERLDLINRLGENQSVLNLMINRNTLTFIIPAIEAKYLETLSLPYTLQSLQDTALARRMDIKVHEYDLKFQEANVAYQKALAVPDIRIGGVYDRAGSYIPNYTALSLSADLPLLNRNQGNIAAAKYRKDQSSILLVHHKQMVSSEVTSAYIKVNETNKIYQTIDKNIATDFDDLIEIIMKNYEKRNINLIEFIDYYQAYKSSMLQILKLRNDRIQAFEDLSFTTGKNITGF